MGIPLIEALLGTEALPYAILYDQFGTVIALNTYGVLVAAWYGGQKPAWSSLLKTIVTFPPFGAFCVAMAVVLSPRSEERRVGKECSSRGAADDEHRSDVRTGE